MVTPLQVADTAKPNQNPTVLVKTPKIKNGFPLEFNVKKCHPKFMIN